MSVPTRGSASTLLATCLLPLCILTLCGPSLAAGQPIPPDPSLVEDLNPLLGPGYAQWLVGPLAEIVDEEERERFLGLTSDEEAQRFIEEFWQAHQDIAGIFERRALEADERFEEGHIAGRRTDRGKLFILYGEPAEIGFEEHRNIDDGDVLIWRYERKQAGVGLDGKKPAKLYRFTRIGDQMRAFKRGGPLDPAERRRRDPRNRPFGSVGGDRLPFDR